MRDQFPNAALELLGYPHIAQLALIGSLADRIRSIESQSLAPFFAPNTELNPTLAAYFAEFGLIVSYLYDPDDIFKSNVARCTRAQFIAGPHRPNEKIPIHATQTFLKPLQRLAIFDPDPLPQLDLAPSLPTDIPFDLTSNPCLALHPGSGSERKNWPEPHWAALLSLLIKEPRLNLLLVGGESEHDRLKRLAAPLPPARVRIALNQPLPHLAALLKTCRAFIGHDSGITHLAAAIGLPGIALWAESNLTVWRPLSPLFTILQTPNGLPNLPVNTVHSHLLKLIR